MNIFRGSMNAATLCVVVLLTVNQVCLGDYLREQQDDEELLPMGDDGSLFLAGVECGPNEKLVPGALPTCEPTCRNPRPICPKIFFTSLDVVPCFCKEPLVRNEQTKQCVQLSECPKLPEVPRRTRLG